MSCLSPGPVFTKPESVKDTNEKLGCFGVQLAGHPKKVGEIAVKKTLKGRMMIVPGTLSKVVSGFIRILPKRWVVSIYNKVGG